ncbi:hypothetical protein M406DRAFT_245447, partial [Cryphonectria parasitica EP155]
FEKMKYALHCSITCMKELNHMKAKKAEAERIYIAAEVQAVVAEKSAVVTGDSSFEGFDWNSVDLGDSVVDWLGFLKSEISEASGFRFGAERLF